MQLRKIHAFFLLSRHLPGKLRDGTHRLTGPYSGKEKRVEIPSELGGNLLTEIYQDTFNGAGLEEVIFTTGSKVEQIHARAFQNNNIQQVVLPESLETLDWGAFRDNPISQVTIGSAVNITGQPFSTPGFKTAYDAGGEGTYILENGQWKKQQ